MYFNLNLKGNTMGTTMPPAKTDTNFEFLVPVIIGIIIIIIPIAWLIEQIKTWIANGLDRLFIPTIVYILIGMIIAVSIFVPKMQYPKKMDAKILAFLAWWLFSLFIIGAHLSK